VAISAKFQLLIVELLPVNIIKRLPQKPSNIKGLIGLIKSTFFLTGKNKFKSKMVPENVCRSLQQKC